MSAESNRQLGHDFFMAQDRLKGHLDPNLCAAAYVGKINSNSPLDREGHGVFAASIYDGCPDLRHVVEQVVTEGERVVVHFRVEGTHTAHMWGIPATGKAVDVPAIAILTVEDGKVAQLHAVFDQAGLMQQLGATG